MPSSSSQCQLPYLVVLLAIRQVLTGVRAFLSNHDEFFTVLEEVNVTIRPKKSSVGFPGVKMLGHFVDGFGLASLDERIEAIRNIVQPT